MLVKEYTFHGHHAEQLVHPGRVEAHRSHRHHVAEAHHHRRHEDRHQQQRRDPAAARQVGAHHQEGQHAAQRHRDRGQAGGQQHAVLEGQPEVGVVEDEAEGVQPEHLVGHEERRRQDALVEDQEQRQEDRQAGQHDHDGARPVGAEAARGALAVRACDFRRAPGSEKVGMG
jgi:hypothetical protein